ncbi:MAG: alpha/beta hydrolase [Flavisolibacter sp.]|nr:alpha/beta hydrolase [Flavisolibacter sp.]
MGNFVLALLFLLFSNYSSAQDTCFTRLPYGNNPQAGAYANVNGIRMYYETYGSASARPLLLIHGNGGSIWSMRCQIEHFRQTYKVIVADSRYHGKSENGDKPLTYELMADDYAALLQHLKLDSVYTIGQSDGAILTLLLAMNHPGSIKKGIAMAPNLRPDSTAQYGYIVRTVKQTRDSVEGLIRSGRKDAALLRESVYYQLMDEQPNIPAASLSHIQVPILLMSSDGDAITLEHILEIYRALPKANLLVMPAATHRMLREEYQLFNQMCQRFLDNPFKRPTTIY